MATQVTRVGDLKLLDVLQEDFRLILHVEEQADKEDVDNPPSKEIYQTVVSLKRGTLLPS